ncbi:MAG: hypothetical protein K1X78_26355 [Verrucomicrobiaceae bacterium]|nr:hypothetical protein [Verrucomicrobiaceae bacterium]
MARLSRESSASEDDRPVGRRTPAKGVLPTYDGATTLWCTVCTEDRAGWCATDEVMSLLHDIWQNVATAWLVGDYLLMPDHVHFFCSPAEGKYFEVERWTLFWKDRFSKRCGDPEWPWQRGVFHHRLRSEGEYSEKMTYMRNNPVRKALVR